MLSDEDKQQFRDVINETLDSRNRIDQPTHKDHHDFVEMLQRERKERHAMWEKVKGTVMGWFIIVVLGGIGTAVYQTLFKHK